MYAQEVPRSTVLPQRVGLDPLASARRTELHLPANLALAGWRRVGQQIALLSSSSAWWLGDWLIYGQARFPDRYKQAVEETSLDYQTLRNYAWVARKFPVSRRRDTLSFQHHAAVASLPTAEQDLWLDRASAGRCSVAELRARLKAAAAESTRGQKQARAVLQLSICGDRQQRWEAAARSQSQNLIDWAVDVLDTIATQIINDR
jgi:hypothetical protein